MPRKAFVADLQEAVELPDVGNVFDLKAGDEDGSLTFKYECGGKVTPSVTLQALVPDVGEYPNSHQYMVYTTSENVPKSISEALTDFSIFDGLKVSQMLFKLTKTLDKATAGSRHNPVSLDEDAMDIDTPLGIQRSEVEEEEYEEDDEESIGSDGGWSPRPFQMPFGVPHRSQHSAAAVQVLNTRVRSDIRALKEAGFRVGLLGDLLHAGQNCFLTVSRRTAKLGISDEAIQAWHLDRKQYIVLLVHYNAGYRTLDTLTAEEPSRCRSVIEMRVGISSKYKISYTEAVNAFSQVNDKDKEKQKLDPKSGQKTKTALKTRSDDKPSTSIGDVEEQPLGGFHGLFISRPLDELLNDRLLPVIRYRMAMDLSWSGAEDYYNDNQGRNLTGQDTMQDKYWAEDSSNLIGHLPKVVTSDHLVEKPKEHSFPLLAMQFTLRHLVRCTEFCLVCHCRIEANFEALKPYVCSKPLCLYQYMALGFGPSIEYEILSQPYVVDLLISFCYASASASRLRSFPLGMGLVVPAPSLIPGRGGPTPVGGYMGRPYMDGTAIQSAASKPNEIHLQKQKAKFDQTRSELLFPPGEKPLKAGDWIYMTIPPLRTPAQIYHDKRDDKVHRRVIETMYPTVRLGPPIIAPSIFELDERRQAQLEKSAAVKTDHIGSPQPTDPSSYLEVEFVVYNQNFDDLADLDKQSSIIMLLETLPRVNRMREFLLGSQGKHISLREWRDRISPAALGVLRWIIASNRACIIQTDGLDEESRHAGDRVSGMKSWMQFRFAMGAPDKEQRFVTAVHQTTDRLKLKYPTFFAWHGSPLHNWHGIIREGLHFKEALHGRAYGDGVYHSLDASTSLGYSGLYNYSHDGSDVVRGWPHSQLKVSSAMSLNEIVNAPDEFQSKRPHLVVSQLDWIQTRYLFVKCNVPEINSLQENVPLQALDQDPAFAPRGPEREAIIVPITAVSRSRRPSLKSVKSGNKKAKVQTMSDLEEVVFPSDDTDFEDLEILYSESEGNSKTLQANTKGKAVHHLTDKKKGKLDRFKTDFVPGELEHSTLPLLAPPSYATTSATKTLQRELKATLKIQETHLLEELGWYLDPELVDNIYQWIVELHSFEPHLPLAKDMKARGVKSIVLEIRFGAQYPISPPFVRVIRPRFLPFMSGGGGHVTGGGALCMELLTNSGWSAVGSIESVLLQVRMAISSTEPTPARLDRKGVSDYGVGEAIDAYKRACKAHGWQIPRDFDAFSGGAEHFVKPRAAFQ